MESCYVPNNPNFAAEQWTPPSPTSPDLVKSNAGAHPEYHSEANNLICDGHIDLDAAAAHYNSFSTLPPVQELLGPCRSPSEAINKEFYSTGYSATTAGLDFDPLPGFFTFNSCNNPLSKQNVASDMNDVGVLLSMKPAASHHASNPPTYPPTQVNFPAAHQQQSSQHQQPAALSPFSAAVAAATQSSGSCMNSSSHPISYSFHQAHGKLPVLTPGYQDPGSFNCLPTPGMFSSMSVNVSMNMTMGMGMPMSYGIESAALPCWNTNPSIHVPVALQQNNMASAGHNGYHSGGQGLLSPIQMPYSHLAPNSYNPSSAATSSYPFLNTDSWRSPEAALFDSKEHPSSSLKPQSPRINSNFAPFSDSYNACHSTTSEQAIKKRSCSGRHQLHHHQPVHSPVLDFDDNDYSASSSTSSKANLCRICGKTYARPSTLKTHMRTHSGERPYRCGECSKSFSQAANLTAHVRTHSGEKPFKCQICDRRFSQSSSVTTHMRTHSGERPYRCRMCKKAFSDSSTLTKHTRIHSGEKPYQCKLCLLRFSQSGNLNRHMRVHASST